MLLKRYQTKQIKKIPNHFKVQDQVAVQQKMKIQKTKKVKIKPKKIIKIIVMKIKVRNH